MPLKKSLPLSKTGSPAALEPTRTAGQETLDGHPASTAQELGCQEATISFIDKQPDCVTLQETLHPLQHELPESPALKLI